MITQRFGAMAPDTQLKLEAANPKQLIAWGRNFVDATTLDEIFRNK
jgi:hypothetical protein